MTIHLVPLLPAGFSCQPGPRGLKRPICGPYLALLRAGLAMPALLPGPRCALTAPFHRYRRNRRQSILCGAFPGVAPAGRYPAPLFHGVRTFLDPGSDPRPRPSSHPRDFRFMPAHRLGQVFNCSMATADNEAGQRHCTWAERAIACAPCLPSNMNLTPPWSRSSMRPARICVKMSRSTALTIA